MPPHPWRGTVVMECPARSRATVRFSTSSYFLLPTSYFLLFTLGFALPNPHAPRPPGGGDSPARATPNVRPIGRAVKLDALPPPPLCLPRTRPLPTFRVLRAFLFFAPPFFFVTPGRLPPLFETRRVLPPVLCRPATPRRPPARGEPPLLVVLAIISSIAGFGYRQIFARMSEFGVGRSALAFASLSLLPTRTCHAINVNERKIIN